MAPRISPSVKLLQECKLIHLSQTGHSIAASILKSYITRVKFNFGFSIQLSCFFQCRKVTLLFTKRNPTMALCLFTIHVSCISLSHGMATSDRKPAKGKFYVLCIRIFNISISHVSHVSILPRQGYNTLDDSDFSTSGESAKISLLSSCFLSSLSCQASQPCALCPC